jgi:carboxypeptidase family protein
MQVMNARRIARVVMVSCFLLAPAAARAQVNAAIAGVVKDTSGAVMPGVTVEATSPALIEKVRTGVTDDQGQYKVVDLRPGTYVVTFSLPGFSTVKREGLELTTAFTTTVNAELKVGALEETVTVSGAAPVVDTQNVIQQQTIARSTLDAVPTTRRSGAYASLLPGAVGTATTQDVGGTQGEGGAPFSIHGGRSADINFNREGLDATLFSPVTYSFNPQNTQEIVLETSGVSAESFTAGVLVNIVSKDGGNTFGGGFATAYTNPHLQSSNLTDALRVRGLLATPSVRDVYDVSGSVGGPIMKDKLWFFTAHRKWAASTYIPGNFYNRLQGTLFYAPDPSRPAFRNDFYRDDNVRLTWQASSKDKIAASYSIQDNCNCPIDNLGTGTTIIAPEAAGDHFYQPNWVAIVSWNRPATNRLLFEAASSMSVAAINAKAKPEVGPNDIAVTDLATNLRYGSRANAVGNTCCYSTNNISSKSAQRFAVSYITGSHAFKVGFSAMEMTHTHRNENNVSGIHGARSYTFRNQVPQSVTIYATPYGVADHATTLGVYGQDQWTVRKLTLNLGVRYDSFNASIPAQHFSAGLFVPARDLPAVKNSPYWKNIDPRLGASYDLFGTGRTALKAFLGRYVSGTSGNGNAALNNPISNQASSATRTWTDRNGDYIPDCVLDASVPGVNGECGLLSDTSFGQVRAGNTSYAADALAGFNDSQFYNWQSSISVQHELRPGLALNVGYFRTWYGNFLVTDNQAVTPANYDTYCITAPTDGRLPGGGGNQICGLYDVTPTLFGRVNNVVTRASNFGTQTEVFNGVDVTLSARFAQGGQVSGGMSTGRTVTDNCYQNGDPTLVAQALTTPTSITPRTEAFCHVTPPWSAATQLKFLAVYPLPWRLQISATYQNLPGIPVTATYVAANAQIVPSLGRNLASGAGGTATIDLIPAGMLYEDRIQQLDVRFSRLFQFGRVKVRGNFDIYNALNASPILSTNTRYGAQWLNVQQILAGRLFKFGGQLDF